MQLQTEHVLQRRAAEYRHYRALVDLCEAARDIGMTAPGISACASSLGRSSAHRTHVNSSLGAKYAVIVSACAFLLISFGYAVL